jgi:hypothetical protein
MKSVYVAIHVQEDEHCIYERPEKAFVNEKKAYNYIFEVNNKLTSGTDFMYVGVIQLDESDE